MTIQEAARRWVNSFNAIPRGIVCKLMNNNPAELIEVTPLVIGDDVYAPGIGEADVLEIDGNIATIQGADGAVVEAEITDLDIERFDYLPIWGTMWAFSDTMDREWLADHLEEMGALGFRIYEQEDYGYIFGIDGAGYDFYEAHWIPLYKARGLCWDSRTA